MQNSQDLGQALQNFQKQLQKSTAELQAKDKAFREKEIETKNLKDEIDEMQRGIEIKRRQWSENERMLPRLRADVERANMEHKRTLEQVEEAKRTAESSLKNLKK